MSSLWTPGGEHQVLRQEPDASGSGSSSVPPASDLSSSHGDTASPEEPDDAEAAREQLASLERELVSVPAADIVANHCYGLFELAAVHLRQRPPRLADAQLAIDALGAIVERLGERLGDAAATLVEGLTQIRLAYVRLAQSPPKDEAQP
jgi:hypothetical protein